MEAELGISGPNVLFYFSAIPVHNLSFGYFSSSNSHYERRIKQFKILAMMIMHFTHLLSGRF